MNEEFLNVDVDEEIKKTLDKLDELMKEEKEIDKNLSKALIEIKKHLK